MRPRNLLSSTICSAPRPPTRLLNRSPILTGQPHGTAACPTAADLGTVRVSAGSVTDWGETANPSAQVVAGTPAPFPFCRCADLRHLSTVEPDRQPDRPNQSDRAHEGRSPPIGGAMARARSATADG